MHRSGNVREERSKATLTKRVGVLWDMRAEGGGGGEVQKGAPICFLDASRVRKMTFFDI